MALERARLVGEFADTLPTEDRAVAIEIYNLANQKGTVAAWAFGLFFAVALPMVFWGNRFGMAETPWMGVSFAAAALVCWVVLTPVHRRRRAQALALMGEHPALTARVRQIMESV